MHVCLTCIELFGDSIYGGFGRATRFIGRELMQRGVRVSIVVPRRSPIYPDRYELDGIPVYQYRPDRPWQALRIFRSLDADVYHSQDTSLGTALARVARPWAAHVVTFRDPMDRGRVAGGIGLRQHAEAWLGALPELSSPTRSSRSPCAGPTGSTAPPSSSSRRQPSSIDCAGRRASSPPRSTSRPPVRKADRPDGLLRRPMGRTQARGALLRARAAVP